MEALDEYFKIFENKESWRLVLLIDGTPICDIEGACVSLILVIDICYHVTMLSISIPY